MLKEFGKLDSQIDETYYWAHFVVCYFDPWAGSEVEDREDTSSALGDKADELKIEENGVACVTGNFRVAPRGRERMIVRGLCGRQHNSRYVVLVEMRPQKSKPAVFEKPSYSNTT